MYECRRHVHDNELKIRLNDDNMSASLHSPGCLGNSGRPSVENG